MSERLAGAGRHGPRRLRGAPVAADVLTVDGRIAEVGPGDRRSRRARARRGWCLRRPRVHRHAHPPRPPAVLGPGLRPDAPARRDHGAHRQLLARARPGAPRGDRRAVDAVLLHRGHAPRGVRARASRGRGSATPSTATRSATVASRVHAAVLLGHSALRLYVMGDDAWERAATDDERAEIAALLDESVGRGRVRVLDVVLRCRRAEPPGPEPPVRRRRARRAARGAGPAGPRVRRVHPDPRSRPRASPRWSASPSCARDHGVDEHHQRAGAQRVAARLRRRLPRSVPRPTGAWQRPVAPDVAAHHRLPDQLGDLDGLHEPVGVAPHPQRSRRHDARRTAARSRVAGRGACAVGRHRPGDVPDPATRSGCASSRSPTRRSSVGSAGRSPTWWRSGVVTRPTCSPTGCSRTTCGRGSSSPGWRTATSTRWRSCWCSRTRSWRRATRVPTCR